MPTSATEAKEMLSEEVDRKEDEDTGVGKDCANCVICVDKISSNLFVSYKLICPLAQKKYSMLKEDGLLSYNILCTLSVVSKFSWSINRMMISDLYS